MRVTASRVFGLKADIRVTSDSATQPHGPTERADVSGVWPPAVTITISEHGNGHLIDRPDVINETTSNKWLIWSTQLAFDTCPFGISGVTHARMRRLEVEMYVRAACVCESAREHIMLTVNLLNPKINFKIDERWHWIHILSVYAWSGITSKNIIDILRGANDGVVNRYSHDDLQKPK